MNTQLPEELQNQAGEIVKRVNEVQGALQKARPIRKPVVNIVWACFVLGAICIAFCLYQAFLGTASSFTWGILFVGLVLCTISMLSKFEIGPSGVTGEVRDVLNLAKNLITRLTQ